MTHLTDYSYVDRAVVNFCLLLWSIYHIRQVSRGHTQGFWHSVRDRSFKSWAAIFLVSAVVSCLVYDVLSLAAKYNSGFIKLPNTGQLIETPRAFYSDDMYALVLPGDILWNMAASFQLTALILTVALWHDAKLFTRVTPEASRRTCRIYAGLAAFNLLLFPVVQGVSSDDPIATVVVPHLVLDVFGVIMAIVLLVHRFKFMNTVSRLPAETAAASRLRGYADNAMYLAIALTIQSTCMLAIHVDVAYSTRLIYDNKLARDILTRLYNFAWFVIFFINVLVLYPADAVHFRRNAGVANGKNSAEFKNFDPNKCINVVL